MKVRLMIVGVAVVAVCLAVQTQGQGSPKVTLKDAKGNVVGTAVLTAAPGTGVQIALDITKLPPGEHGMHIHQNAKCEPAGPAVAGAPPPTDFSSAGPHFNPGAKKHGTLNPDGPHAGDMNNFIVDADGKAKKIVTDARVSMGTDANSIFSNGGTALVIHAAADDMKTDPSGNSGARIACGVIAKAGAIK